MRAAALIVLLLPATAFAQETDDDLQRAVVLFEESETFYNQGEFAQAAALVRRAYDLHPNATLLFNLARALEGMGDLDGSIESYERYLAEADEPEDRGAVERRIQTLRGQRDALSAAAEHEQESEPDAQPEPEPEGASSSVDPAPWIFAATSVLAVGGGIPLGIVSQDLAREAAVEPVQLRAAGLQSDAEAFATSANLLFILGGAIVLAGVIWGIVVLSDGD